MIVRIVLIGMAVCLLNTVLKKQSSEFVLPVELIFVALSVFLVIEYLQVIFSDLSEIISRVQCGEDIFAVAVKGTGICLLTKFAADICTESNNKAIADVIEFTGRIMLVIVAVPYVKAIINIAFAFIE